MMDSSLFWLILIVVMIISMMTLVNVAVLALMFKLYTEYFKDRSQQLIREGDNDAS